MLLKNFSSFVKLKPVVAVGFLFACSSLLFGTWVAAIPGIKQRLDFTDGSLGLSLLLSPLGAITGVFLSTKVFGKIPVGKWMLAGYIIQSIIMIALINSVNRPMCWVSLYCLGLVSFLNGVSSNATVNIMEQKYDRLLMSSCHALYSLGGFVSAGFAALMFTVAVPSGLQIVIMSAIIVAINISNRHHLLANKEIIHSGSGLKLPSLSILSISFICMVLFMAEGCVADWSAIYFKEVMKAPKELISLGYAGFSIAMTIGRLNGDSIVSVLGNKKTVIAGSLTAATGFLIVVLSEYVGLAIAGYVIIGFGCSGIVPILFRASANIPGVSKVEGFAMVTTGGLIGFLAGPSVIGIISEKASLSKGLSLLIVMMIMAAIVAWKNKFLAGKKMESVSENFDEQLY
ncbi:MAG TPA: MFS transporter [Ferruginibacter sp.]|nr:MFS transporter [Ferruginibacter sp.]HPH89435.1 MFS transporter [Ferruginibacter sp.]